MRILVVSQYFWPENFRVNDLCLELNDRGHNVTVLTGKPNYPIGTFSTGYTFFNKSVELWNGIKIIRVPLIPRGNGNGLILLLNYLSFAFFSTYKMFFIKGPFDKIIVYQLSPATVGIPGLVAKKRFKVPLYFYIQDLWPESLSDAGGFKVKLLLKMVNNLMNYFYAKSDVILVQSNGFIEFLVNKGVEKNKIKYLPNTVEQFYKPELINENYNQKFPNGFRVLFAGNIGFAQDFDTIIKAAKLVDEKGLAINWVVLGDGRGKALAIEKIKSLNLVHRFFFLGSFPSNEMPFFFACADVLLVSLKKSLIFSLTIPSKIQSYLACRKPIIANIEGIAASTILEAKAGLCSESGNFQFLANNIETLYNKSISERAEYAVNGYDFFLENFERTIVYNKLEMYLKLTNAK